MTKHRQVSALIEILASSRGLGEGHTGAHPLKHPGSVIEFVAGVTLDMA